ncbi:hypothetical protein B0H17DRAFT_1136954 [Mycena rosella]|uniref:Uncharacterized protein n=1 Tax=Mycena rosella TaxID=1033263 RepID=A0AAD7D9K0_MYCRO|nr:hypothetical protein B0H17DRAFT_1136954 [Mycena rosella]
MRIPADTEAGPSDPANQSRGPILPIWTTLPDTFTRWIHGIFVEACRHYTADGLRPAGSDSGKLSKIAGECVAQRRRRWDSDVDEIVNTFANVLRITHDGPVVPRKLEGAVFFMGIIKQGSSDLMRRDSQWSSFFGWRTRQDPLMMGWKAIHFPPDLRCIIARSGGTTDSFDGTDHGALIVPGLCIYSVAAQYGRNGTFGAFGRKAKQRQMIGYHRMHGSARSGKRHLP